MIPPPYARRRTARLYWVFALWVAGCTPATSSCTPLLPGSPCTGNSSGFCEGGYFCAQVEVCTKECTVTSDCWDTCINDGVCQILSEGVCIATDGGTLPVPFLTDAGLVDPDGGEVPQGICSAFEHMACQFGHCATSGGFHPYLPTDRVKPQ